MKYAVGLSGGVDSSVSALLLKRQGHEVVGLTMKIWQGKNAPSAKRGNACYGPEEEEDIGRTQELCRRLGIEGHVIDCSAQYGRIVLDYFKQEYCNGRTPNPCIRCNHEVKFGVLPELARRSGISFDRFATGHYARIEYDTRTDRFLLKKGVDDRKDQSYFLYRLSQEQLGASLFPIGSMHKTEVRAMAKEAGLPVHDKEESQDFYSGDYADIISAQSRPGDIVDKSGAVLGRHTGIWNYTVGQRRGLGIAYREPLYVLAIDTAANRVVVGTEKETMRSAFIVNDCSWIAFEKPDGAFSAEVKIRSASSQAPARIEPRAAGSVRIVLAEPVSSVTPGQSAVLYRGDTVLGGGIIDHVE